MSTQYHVYSNGGRGDPIDYGHPVATVDGLSWRSSALAAPGLWKFGVRAFDATTGLEEANIDAAVAINLGASGQDVSNLPNTPMGLNALPRPNGIIRVEWTYPLGLIARKPTGFHVYAGIGSISYATPLATVAATGDLMGRYSTTISGLIAGNTYLVGVRAFNAVGEESNTGSVSCRLVSGALNPVLNLTSTATAIG